jgi:GntR family transcriptional repressor for pyruvate dehydrogenase complex
MAIAKTSTKTRSVADRGQEHPFRPIMALKAALEVVDQLTFAILAGWYEPGDKLPIIPELSKAMKVSPPVVGEAIHLLSDARVLDIRRGNQGGITVRSAEIPLSITKLLRPRRLSSALMTVVEARRTVVDFVDLKRTNERLVLARGKPRPWTQAHNAFHYTIGRAAGNVLLAHTQHELLEEIALMLHNFEQRFMDPDRTIREHHDTLAALRTRDPDAAERMMNQQLLEFEELATRFDARKNSRRTSR